MSCLMVSRCCISRDDFDFAELAGKGGLQKMSAVCGHQLAGVVDEMNQELVA